MKKTLWSIMLDILKLALLLFTASRTLDLFQRILGPENMAVGLFGLAALDGGLIGWSQYYMHSARGSLQNAIALLMTIVDLVGVVIAFLGDMIMQAASRGVVGAMDENTAMTVIIALAAIIGINIAAGVFVGVSDPKLAQQRKEQEQLDKIQEKVLEHMASESDAIAARMVPQLVNAWSQRTQEQLIANAERQWSVARSGARGWDLVQPAARPVRNVTPKPSVMDKIKERLGEVITPAGGGQSLPGEMATLASDGVTVYDEPAEVEPTAPKAKRPSNS